MTGEIAEEMVGSQLSSRILAKKKKINPGEVANTCNPSIGEAETGGFLGLSD